MKPMDFWNMSPFEFNEWRRNNDIPKLVKIFNSKLPDFNLWKSRFSITDEMLILSDNIGLFFQGQNKKCFFEYEENGYNRFGFFEIESNNDNVLNQLEGKYWIFTPYIKWALIEKSWNRLGETKNHSILKRFIYTKGNYYNLPKKSQWEFADSFWVTKLGGEAINFKLT